MGNQSIRELIALGLVPLLSYFTPIVYTIQPEDFSKFTRLQDLEEWEHFLYQTSGKLFNLPILKINSC
jgi:hypothetical protein